MVLWIKFVLSRYGGRSSNSQNLNKKWGQCLYPSTCEVEAGSGAPCGQSPLGEQPDGQLWAQWETLPDSVNKVDSDGRGTTGISLWHTHTHAHVNTSVPLHI